MTQDVKRKNTEARGRDSLLKKEPAIADVIVDYLLQGGSIDGACKAAGVSRDVFFDARTRAKEDIENGIESHYTEFHRRVQKAQARVELDNVKIILNASEKNWQAAGWYLERTRRESYSLHGDAFEKLSAQVLALEERLQRRDIDVKGDTEEV